MTDSPPNSFTALWTVLRQVDFFGTFGPPIANDAATLTAAMGRGAPMLPRAYTDAYVTPVQAGLPRLLGLLQAGQIHAASVELVTGAVAQHEAGGAMGAPLRRFTAVISNLYRSFMDAAKRQQAAMPLRGVLPPLAAFQHDGSNGPITIAIDLIDQVLGGQAGVVGLPASFADHPLLWAALAHETGGHDVTHADPGLLDQLGAGLGSCFTAIPGDQSPAQMTQLWSYWMDEAAADVYGLLNIGPSFADNLAVFLAAMNGGDAPSLRMQSLNDPGDRLTMLDPHPTDILRLHLLLGAMDSLAGLAAGVRADAVARVEALAARLGSGGTIALSGRISDARGKLSMLKLEAPRAPMQQAARAVGAYIATTRLQALDGKSIQDIETWDDTDEAVVQAIRAALREGTPIVALGDDAQLLAGANLAAFDDPARYAEITAALNDALDHSFSTDPLWGTPEVDRLYIRYAT